jgi:archaellum component FlaG (FlaF/FlaG flagellin family)
LLNIIDEPEETNYSEEWAAELSTTDIVKNIKEKLDANTKEDFDNVINGKNVPKKSLTRIREVTREIISQEKKNAE